MDEYSYIIIFARYICETKRIRNKITYSLPLGIAMLICVRKSAFFKSRAAHAALLSKMQIYEHILHRDTEAGVNNQFSAGISRTTGPQLIILKSMMERKKREKE